MRALIAFILALPLASVAAAQKPVSFPTEDGGVVCADVYGEAHQASKVFLRKLRFVIGSKARVFTRRQFQWRCWCSGAKKTALASLS